MVLSACADSDDATGPDTSNGGGFMKAEISGAYETTIDITNVGSDGHPPDEPEILAGGHWSNVQGHRVLSIGGMTDLFGEDSGFWLIIAVLEPKIGTYSGSDICVLSEEDDDCHVAATLVVFDSDTSLQASLETGRLEIVLLGENRVAGSFELKGPSRSILDEDSPSTGTIHVRNGVFDLPVVDDDRLSPD